MKIAGKHHDLLGLRSGKLPMTPMIDVVFLLLIFFMVTVSSTPAESDLSSALQQQNNNGASSDFMPQIVSVERQGDRAVYRLGGHVMHTRDELTRILRELPKASGVVVKVANDVPVDAAATALQACKDAKFEKVSYVPAK